MTELCFRALGLQQIAIGGPATAALIRLRTGLLGVEKSATSEVSRRTPTRTFWGSALDRTTWSFV